MGSGKARYEGQGDTADMSARSFKVFWIIDK